MTMLRYLRAFAAFWYDFIVGDDWRVAAGVVLALGGTFVVAHGTKLPAWWVLPVALLILLPTSVRRVVRRR